MKLTLIIIGFILVMISCKKDEVKTIQYNELSAFNKLDVRSPFVVFLAEDSVYYIEVTGYENETDNLIFTVTDSTLKITNNAGFKFVTPRRNRIKVIVHSPPLKMVMIEDCILRTLKPVTSVNGFGLVFSGKACEAFLELNCKELYYWNNFPCGGKLKLTGNTEILKLWNFAIAGVDAENLSTGFAEVKNSSKGDCSVNVNDRLVYSITGEGNIHLWGNPSEVIQLEMTSDGRLIRH